MNCAAIDIGTNSVRLLIVGTNGEDLCRDMEITRLGQGVDKTRALNPDAIDRTLRVLERYAGRLKTHHVSRLRVTSTSAARDAQNRTTFLDAVTAVLGQPPEILSGQEEAELTFLGATASLTAAPAPRLVFDIGGGSTEFVLGTNAPEHLVSLDMGCVRLTERHFMSGDKPSAEQLAAAHLEVRELLQVAAAAVPFQEARSWIGVAGTVTTFAAVVARLDRYDPKLTHGFVLTRDAAEKLYMELTSLSAAELKLRLYDPKRAGVIVGGAVVLLEILRTLNVEEVIVSERDILDGLAASQLR